MLEALEAQKQPKQPDYAYKTLLSRRQNLYKSIRKQPGKGKVTIYTNVPYATAHNEGTNNAGRNHRVRIPKWQFIGPSKRLNDKVRKMIDDEIRKAEM